MVEPHVVYLADHSFILALPAFAPAVFVAAAVACLAMRDRRRRAEPPHGESAAAPAPGHEDDRDDT
jgi:hypothetical protein